MMTDDYATRDRAVVEFPRHAVGSAKTAIGCSQDSIAVGVMAAPPNPTAAPLLNLGPEAILQGFRLHRRPAWHAHSIQDEF